MQIIGALLFAYFVSRALERINWTSQRVVKIAGTHVASFIVISLVAIAMRQPLNIFNWSQLYLYGLAQAVWLLLDLYRARIAFWKPPATPVTETSPTKLSGSNR